MLHRLFAIVLFLSSATAPAVAQTVDGALQGSSIGEAQTVAETGDEAAESVSILVAGDAIGGGLGAGLSRMAEADGGFDVTIRFNEESGFARPEVYDWGETVPKILEGKDYDVIVVQIGTNDRQAIRSGSMRLGFGTPEWAAAYRAQLGRVLDGLMASGARVYWVGMPPMADRDYDAAMQTITAIQKERAEAKGAVFLDIRPAFLNPDGSYTDTGPDDTGQIRKLRGRDGITFFKQGNNRLGQLILEAIETGAPVPGTAPAAAKSDALLVAQPAADAVAVPLFGQTALFGEAITMRPKDIMTVALVALGKGDLAPSAALAALHSLARPGSEAEKLFATGVAGPAPAGRVDNFAAPPLAPP